MYSKTYGIIYMHRGITQYSLTKKGGDYVIIDRIYYNIYINGINGLSYDDYDYDKLDIKSFKKVLGYYNTLLSKYNMYDSNIISNFLYDVNSSLMKCDFTDVQKRRLEKWFDGLTEGEIAESEGVSRWVVSKSIHAGCNKLLLILREK